MARIFNSFLIVVAMGLWVGAASAQGRPIASLSVQSPTVEEGGHIGVILTLDRPAPLNGPLVEILLEETIYPERHISPVYFLPESNEAFYFRVPEGETRIERTIEVPNNDHLDGTTEVTLTARTYKSVTINPNARTATVRIRDSIDEVSVGLKATRLFWYENETHAELQVEVIDGSFVNYDYSLVFVNEEGSASRHNDYVDASITGTFVMKAGSRSQIARPILVNSMQLEGGEFFKVSLFRSGLTAQVRILCHPDPIGPSTVDPDDCKIALINIKDDDAASLSILSQDSPAVDLAPTSYFAPGDNIKMYVTVDEETGDCIIPFPMTVDLRAHGDTHVLSKDLEEDIRFSPCVPARPNNEIGFLFPVKPAAELNPGIYDIDIMIEPQGNWDSRIYVRQSHWPVRVCVPGTDVDCSTFIAPPAPTLTTPPQVVPPVEEVGNTTQPPATQSGGTTQPPATQSGGTTRRPPSRQELPPAPSEPVGTLENPGPNAFQSGISVISGWVCDAEAVEIELNGVPQAAAYGTERLDTESACGDTDNGFGLLFNWNLLGDGEHEVVAYVDDVELGRTTVTVTTLGEEFVRGVTGTCEAPDFPMVGETGALAWQETQQNFVLVSGMAPSGENRAGSAGVEYLDNPGPDSFQSGIGVISGWVCAGETVEVALGDLGRQGAAYGTERLDTLQACGDTDNGFGLLFNWNLLGDGEHAVVAYVDDMELGRATVRVTTLGEEFLRGVEGECVVPDFPSLGETVTLEWHQNSQNFVITQHQ